MSATVGDDATVDATDVSLHAENENLLIPIAGAVAVATGDNFSIGANVALAFVDTNVEASVADSAEVTALGDVTVFASNRVEVVSVAASLAISTDSTGGAGSASSINLNDSVKAFVGGTLHADGSLYLGAVEHATVIVVAGGAGGGDSGVGLSVANVNIGRHVQAYIGDEATGRAVVEWSHFKTFQDTLLRGDEWYRFDAATGLIAEIRAYYAAPQPPEGYHPIVFCRYIPTAEYVTEPGSRMGMPSLSRPSAVQTVTSLTSRVLAEPSACLPSRP